MGYDATVVCSCFRLGKTVPPPFVEHVKTEDNWFPYLDLPYVGNESKFAEFEQWLLSACCHSGMEYTSERLGNIATVAHFRHAVRSAGPENFPVLWEDLLDGHAETSSPERANAILQELDQFLPLLQKTGLPILAHEKTAKEANIGYHLPNRIWQRLDWRGFVLEQNGQKELFRSRNFLIKVRGVFLPKAEFVALDSNQRVHLKLSFFAPREFAGPFIVERQDPKPDDYQHVLQAIRRICRASIEMQNPIRWSH